MFSKTIFKQTFKSNYKLWLVFTIIMCVLSSVIISVYDPQAMSGMMDMMKDSPIGAMLGDRLDSMTSLLGMLGSNFYVMIGVILPMIYIIITANSLVAAQVDRGSMAYTLSTPIKRTKVIATQAIYLISAIFLMVTTLTVVGLSMVQIMHGGVISEVYTEDVNKAAEVLDKKPADIEDHLQLILDNEKAIKEGAKVRGVDEDVYVAYVTMKLTEQAYEAAADQLDKEVEAVKKDPTQILKNKKALSASAKVMDLSDSDYQKSLEMTLAQQPNKEQAEQMQNSLMEGLTAAAKEMDMDVSDLSQDMAALKKNQAALQTASTVSKIPEEQLVMLINQQLATQELSLDEGVQFDVSRYIMLNVGLFLLLFAISSISFASSCIFNLSKYSMTFGAGLPIAFFVFQIMSQTSEDLENVKYLSLNTLFDTNAIISGGDYLVQFCVLFVIGILLYGFGLYWFKRKDLPL